MRQLTFVVPERYDGCMAKHFLKGYCGVSTRLMLALKNLPGGIMADGGLLRTIDRLQVGQTVTLRLPDDQTYTQPNAAPLSLLYEDADVLVADKPAGMPVHPSAGHARDTLANAVSFYLLQKGEPTAFRPVCRLDRDTSGVVVAAKHAYAAARLAGKVEKVYYTIVQGELQGAGTINAPLRHKEGYGIRREIGLGGERAVTHWRVLAAGCGHTLLRVVLETGRTHQIRAHFEGIGHPLAGDDMYGGARLLLNRQALHCAAAFFVHPVGQCMIQCVAPLPEDMRAALRACGFDAVWEAEEAALPAAAQEYVRESCAVWEERLEER